MSELPDLDDAMFKLATGEEFVLPADTPPTAASASPNGGASQQGVPAGLTPVGPRPVARPTWRDKRTAGRLRARKVRRLVRHVEPWSVLKAALIDRVAEVFSSPSPLTPTLRNPCRGERDPGFSRCSRRSHRTGREG